MKKANKLWLPLLVLLLAMVVSCSRPYVITEELAAPFNRAASCSIGEITDALPFDFEAAKKPTAENIEKFKGYLGEALQSKEIFGEVNADLTTVEYEVTGGILDYEKGSGFLRFLFGAWAGGSKVTVSLQLLKKGTKNVVFGGNFTGMVSSWMESGDKMFEHVAKNFAGKLNKELKNFEKKK